MYSSSMLKNFASKNDGGKNWPQYLAVFTASLASFSSSLHQGWPAPSIPKLLSDEYPFDVTKEDVSYITIIGFVGSIVGGFGNLLLDKIGRRYTVLLIAVPQFISYSLIALSYNSVTLLYVARVCGGVSEGMSNGIIGLYAAEIADPRIRGILGSMLATVFYSGVLFPNLVGSYASIRTTALTFLIFPVIFVVSFWKMPESPYYLLMKNRDGEAKEVLKFLRWKTNVDEEMTVLKDDVHRQMSETGSFRDIFTIDSNRRALIVAAGARFFQVTTGAAAFNLYLQVLLGEATTSLPSHIGATIILLIQVLMTVVTTCIIDKCGRKPILLFSICGCFTGLFIQTIYYILRDYTSVDVSVADWFPLMMMVLHIILYSLGMGMVTSVIVSEMFSASVKAKLSCVVNAFYATFALCGTKFYQITADEFGLLIPFASFGILSLIGSLFIWRFVPETKGKSLEEIQQRLKGKREYVPKCDK